MSEIVYMNIFNNHLSVTIALLQRAQPSPSLWRGPAADTCRLEMQKLQHQMTSLMWQMQLLGLIP
jgi:hypothetical protein